MYTDMQLVSVLHIQLITVSSIPILKIFTLVKTKDVNCKVCKLLHRKSSALKGVDTVDSK